MSTLAENLAKAKIEYEYKHWKEAYRLYKLVETENNQVGHVNFRLGVMYQNGFHVKKEVEEGDPEVECDLGYMYDDGCGTTVNKEKAVEYYARAARKGHARGLCNLGYMYDYGEGVEADKTLAVQYYKMAADTGYVMGMCNLAYMYEYGYGVAANSTIAAQLYIQAAEKGYARGQCNLGSMYEGGTGGLKQNYKLAAYYFILSAEQGHSYGCYKAAGAYQIGVGVPKNLTMATKYFFRGTELHHTPCQSTLQNSYLPGNDFQISLHQYFSEEWPHYHEKLVTACHVAILELVLVLQNCKILPELVVLMVKALIVMWPVPLLQQIYT